VALECLPFLTIAGLSYYFPVLFSLPCTETLYFVEKMCAAQLMNHKWSSQEC